MRKDIMLKDGNKIIIDITPGYCTEVIKITKGYFKEKDLIKSISLTIWDDISFHGYINNNKTENILEFEFDINDPIYFCLNRLLNDKELLIIEDDDTYEMNKKYMTIKREEEIIKIIFFNNIKENNSHNKYNVFIKNIGPDSRSKIEDIKMKQQIVKFFRECTKTLLEESHQITIDEYIETSRIKELEEKQNKFTRKRKIEKELKSC